MKTKTGYVVILGLIVMSFSSCYVLEMSRKKEHCELFVLYEVNSDKSKTVMWEDYHCGPGTGMTRMSRRIKRRKLEAKFPNKIFSNDHYPYSQGQTLKFDSKSNSYIEKK